MEGDSGRELYFSWALKRGPSLGKTDGEGLPESGQHRPKTQTCENTLLCLADIELLPCARCSCCGGVEQVMLGQKAERLYR